MYSARGRRRIESTEPFAKIGWLRRKDSNLRIVGLVIEESLALSFLIERFTIKLFYAKPTVLPLHYAPLKIPFELSAFA